MFNQSASSFLLTCDSPGFYPSSALLDGRSRKYPTSAGRGSRPSQRRRCASIAPRSALVHWRLEVHTVKHLRALHDRITAIGFAGAALSVGLITVSFWYEVIARYFLAAPTVWAYAVA